MELDDFYADVENPDKRIGPNCTDFDDWTMRGNRTYHVRCDARGCEGVD